MESSNWWKWALGGCLGMIGLAVVAVVVLLLALGYAIEAGMIASTDALPGNKIPPAQVRTIDDIVSLEPGEPIQYFYSAAFLPSADGNLFTDRRVISYTNEEGTPAQVYEATYEEIADIQFEGSDSWFDDSTIHVTLKDGATFVLWVSHSQGEEFYDRLVMLWNKNRGAEEPPPDTALEPADTAPEVDAEIASEAELP